MNKTIPPIYFYLPESRCSINELPKNLENYWQWQISQGTHNLGDYTWTLLTYLYLKANDFPCHFTNNLPSEGICLSHRSLLPNNLQPNSKLLIVALQSDRGRHPYAQLHVVQNRLQQVSKNPLNLWESFYLPHWTQPGLIARDDKRGDRFENIAFFGQKNNVILQLRQPLWKKTLQELGLRWQIMPPHLWHDYSEADAVIAIRKFGYNWDHSWKPATKLYNSWLAGVPAILGCESAYQAERRSEFDYLEVGSFDALILAIKRLQADKNLRREMLENSKLRAEEVKPQKTVEKWQDFLINTGIPAYQDWQSASESSRQQFLKIRSLAYPFYQNQRQLRFLKAKFDNILAPQNFVGQMRQNL
ncbi:MAG: hypothetical protein AB4372_09025 [Xenococcus sp. (in: cyanobacteria)]